MSNKQRHNPHQMQFELTGAVYVGPRCPRCHKGQLVTTRRPAGEPPLSYWSCDTTTEIQNGKPRVVCIGAVCKANKPTRSRRRRHVDRFGGRTPYYATIS
jgi:hypothetical protein